MKPFLAALALFAAFAPCAQAQATAAGDAKLLAGKKKVATLVRTENGDAACYLWMRDELGAEFMEPGDFEFCFRKPSLAGRLVRLEYGAHNILAAECQGNPDCGKSDRVALVTRILPAALCPAPETVLFSCRAGAKLASVCASKGYVEYRFGKAEDPPEIAVRGAAAGENVPFAGGGGSWIRFRKGDYAYVAYSGIGKWGPNGQVREKQGVVVERGGKAIANVKCTELYETLSREQFEKLGIVPGKDEFTFPE